MVATKVIDIGTFLNGGHKITGYSFTGNAALHRDLPNTLSSKFFNKGTSNLEQSKRSSLVAEKGAIAERIFIEWMRLYSESIIKPIFHYQCEAMGRNGYKTQENLTSTDLLAMTEGIILSAEVKFNQAKSKRQFAKKSREIKKKLKDTKKILNWFSEEASDTPLETLRHVGIIFTKDTSVLPLNLKQKGISDNLSSDELFKHIISSVKNTDSDTYTIIRFSIKHLITMFNQVLN